MKLYAISGDPAVFTTQLLVGDDRTSIMQQFEAHVRARGNVSPARANPAIRRFVEGEQDNIIWAGLRLQLVQLPTETK